MTLAVCDQQLELQPWYSEHRTVSFKKHDHMFAKGGMVFYFIAEAELEIIKIA